MLLFAAFIVYASFYPFQFSEARWQAAMHGPVADWLRFTRTGLGDMTANVVAYLPIGVLLRLCLREGFKGFGLTVLGGLLLSVIVEVLQNTTRHRDPSYIDVGMNTAGTIVGALIATWFRKPLLKAKFVPKAPTAVIVLLVLWGAMHAAPLVPALEMFTVRHSLAGLTPFRFTIEGVARWAAAYMIFAELMRAVSSPKRFGWWLILGLAVTYLCRLVIIGQTLTWNEILGTLVALPLVLIAPRSGKPAWAVLLVLMIGAGLAPFRFDGFERQPFYWVQFDTYQDLVRKAYLAIGASWVGYRAGLGAVASVCIAAAVLFAIEFAQSYMSPAVRVPEYADPLLALSAILILGRK